MTPAIERRVFILAALYCAVLALTPRTLVMRLGFVILLLVGSVAYAFGGELPDPRLTPGVCRDDITVEQICATKWGKDKRHVTAAMKRRVFAAYHIKCGKRCGKLYEIDHLCPRDGGGADVVENLWPQLWAGKWGAHAKDRAETRFNKIVCEALKAQGHDAAIAVLEGGRAAFKNDWRALYIEYFGEPKE